MWRDEREVQPARRRRARSTASIAASTASSSRIGAIEPQFREALFKGLGAGTGRQPRRDRDRHREHAPATNGRRISRAPTPASRRCSTWAKRRSIRTIIARRTFLDLDGVFQPGAGAALFGNAPRAARSAAQARGRTGRSILAELGYGAAEIARAQASKSDCMNPLYEQMETSVFERMSPRRGEAWRGQPGAGVSRISAGRRRSSRRPPRRSSEGSNQYAPSRGLAGAARGGRGPLCAASGPRPRPPRISA